MGHSIRVSLRVVFLTAGIPLVGCLIAFMLPIAAQSQSPKQLLITQPVDEQNLVALGGSVRPEIQAANDLGPVADDLVLSHMYLQLKRAPGQDAAVKTLIDALHDPKAPEYHQWLAAAQIAERFGPADQDVRTISQWLESHGFSVNVVYPQNGVIDFSGPANAVREAFHTEIHQFGVNGQTHIANVSAPQIPAALAPAIVGVVSMNDFHPKPALRPRSQYSFPSGGFVYNAVVPGDLHTIYNFNPLYAAGITGQGQTVVVVEDSDVYNPQDWVTFRKTFGLNKEFPQGSFQQVHPQPSNAPNNGGPCADPGVTYDDDEAIIDAEWASASAPNAAIVVATCANTNANFGAFIALQNLLTGPGRPPGIVSISYAEAETIDQVPPPTQAYMTQLYQLAVLQGVSIFVASGDDGAAMVDYHAATGLNGITVNGVASTPDNVAVGGTDFGDYYLGETSEYWSANNGKYFNSALSYVPEIPWNDSCASRLITNYFGYSTPYGTDGLCNSLAAISREGLLNTGAGGGGPSNCASGTPSIYGSNETNYAGYYAVASGTCKGYPKPVYQRLVPGIPNDGVRDLPDVSLFAADGVWAHNYLFCNSDLSDGPYYGGPCTGAPSTWSRGGGTSFAAPIMAGIQAMINQSTGSYQGNPNYVLYALAALQYNLGGVGPCNSTLGNQTNPSCIFHDVTLGDIDVPCQPLVADGVAIGTFNCYLPSGTYGVLSVSNTSYEPAFPATPGWDFATGLGSVNSYNLVQAWPGSHVP